MTDAITSKNLTYSHISTQDDSKVVLALQDVNLTLPRGSRTLLIGANGAGKSTLLQILAGKRLIKDGDVRIWGKDVFRDSPLGITYLGTEWAMNPVVRSDIVVADFLNSVGGYRHKERRDRLLDILDIDLEWHMHAISDGERRRVQICFGLMVPWDVLLLDEVTVDLDVLVRDHLLSFLVQESVERGATIVYATHIFDGLNKFPTHITHMRNGTFVVPPIAWPLHENNFDSLLSENVKIPEEYLDMAKAGSTLHSIAVMWLAEDRELRMRDERAGKLKRKRGARDEVGHLYIFFLGVSSQSEFCLDWGLGGVLQEVSPKIQSKEVVVLRLCPKDTTTLTEASSTLEPVFIKPLHSDPSWFSTNCIF